MHVWVSKAITLPSSFLLHSSCLKRTYLKPIHSTFKVHMKLSLCYGLVAPLTSVSLLLILHYFSTVFSNRQSPSSQLSPSILPIPYTWNTEKPRLFICVYYDVSTYVNNNFVKYKILNIRIIAKVELCLQHIAAYARNFKWPVGLRCQIYVDGNKCCLLDIS